MSDWRIINGDALAVLPGLPSGSFDAVISDPPYPEISRPYGRMTEAAWMEMMHAVVRECRRLLKPQGSAVFVLQPNSKKVGSMRAWLWEFMAWCCREWNQVQDAWWWNTSAITEAHSIQGKLLRPSLKACVWLGSPDCYRAQEKVYWSVSQANIERAARSRCGRENQPSGHGVDRERATNTCLKRGGVLPFNVLPFGGGKAAGIQGHGAGTPRNLCDWWTRYIVPPGGAILDPFCGSGTTGLAALKHGCSFVGVEKMPEYCQLAERRLREAHDLPLFAGYR